MIAYSTKGLDFFLPWVKYKNLCRIFDRVSSYRGKLDPVLHQNNAGIDAAAKTEEAEKLTNAAARFQEETGHSRPRCGIDVKGIAVIRRDYQGDWFLITQPEHARLSGFLAGHWGGGGGDFVRSEPWDEVCLAAAEHDNGWREWDDRPSLNPEGAPAYMYENPIAEVFKILHRGAGRLIDRGHPYAAALISLHYVNWATDILTGVRSGQWPVTPRLRAEIEAFKAEEEERRDAVCRRLRERPGFEEAAAPEGIRRNGRLVWTFDMLSLIVCCRWPHVESLEAVPSGDGFGALAVELVDDVTLQVNPWPFDGDALEFAVRGRRLPPKPFRRASDFWDVLNRVPGSEIVFRFAPA